MTELSENEITTVFRSSKIFETIEIFNNINDQRTLAKPITIPALMKQICDNYSNHMALMQKGENNEWKGITYKEYRERVEKMAKVFIKLGLEQRGSVAVLAFNSVEWFVTEFAAIHAG